MTQKINLRAENEEGHIPDSACQDHMIGKIMYPNKLLMDLITF